MKKLTLMKVSLSLSFVLGLVAAVSVFYANDASALRQESPRSLSTLEVSSEQLSPETIAAWKSTARATDYISPRVPI